MKEIVAEGARALEPLRKAIKSKDPEVSRLAMQCIAAIEKNLEIAALAAILQRDADPERRAHAALEMNSFGPAARIAVPALLTALDDRAAKVRKAAAAALGNIQPSVKEAIPRMLEILKDSKEAPDVRGAMAGSLAPMGSCAKEAVPVMATILRDRNSAKELRWSVAIAFGSLDPDAEEAVSCLIHILETESPDLQRAAAISLGRIKTTEDRVLRALIAALKYHDAKVQGNAAEALGAIRQDAAVTIPALIDLLKRHQGDKGDSSPRYSALAALRRFGPAAKPAVPILVEIVKEDRGPERGEVHFPPDIEMQMEALRVIQEIGPEARDPSQSSNRF